MPLKKRLKFHLVISHLNQPLKMNSQNLAAALSKQEQKSPSALSHNDPENYQDSQFCELLSCTSFPSLGPEINQIVEDFLCLNY
jgi:hypothetical protein